MSIIKDYQAYCKDNPKQFWFKRKIYGWGWTPVKWQGWLALGLYLGGIVYVAVRAEKMSTNQIPALETVVSIFLLTVMLFAICYCKGESPRWQWGVPQKKD